MVEMDIIALKVQDKDKKTTPLKIGDTSLEVVGTSRGLFINKDAGKEKKNENNNRSESVNSMENVNESGGISEPIEVIRIDKLLEAESSENTERNNISDRRSENDIDEFC